MPLLLRFLMAFSLAFLLSAQPSNVQAQSPNIKSSPPFETVADHQSITLEWESDTEGHSVVKYGLTEDLEEGKRSIEEESASHEITIDDLEPATIYNMKVGVATESDTGWSDKLIVSSGSHEEATQEVNVYFNGTIYEEAATSETATAEHNFADQYIERIDAARESIDITFYNLSQDVGSKITDALINAARRGLYVRVVMHHNLSSQANQNRNRLDNQAGIEVIQSDAGPNEGRSGLMHNKFAIFDYEDDDPQNTWVVVSSWNSTDTGTYDQYQNMIEFQDPALAGGYRTEFNQMFGSEGHSPSASDARFSRNKEIVNPTRFWIGDKELSLYFSPQANSEGRIIEHLEKAQNDIALPTYLITRNEYVDALENLHNDGIEVRGAIGDKSYNESLYDRLSGFADVHDHRAARDNEGQRYPLLHHKSALIDPMNPDDGNGHVITGSMNWSRNGNQFSDENTLIIRDDHITNLYFQEFAARYQDAGGETDLRLTSSPDDPVVEKPEEFSVDQNYPNPFNPVTKITFSLPEPETVTVEIFDLTGRLVETPVNQQQLQSGTHEMSFDGSRLSSGTYIYTVTLGSGESISRNMTLIK